MLPLFPVLYALSLYLGRAPRFDWYLAPMLFSCLMLAGLGIGQLLSWLVEDEEVRPWRTALPLAALLCSVLVALPMDQVHQREVCREGQERETRDVAPRAYGCAPTRPPHARIAMEAIGYQGYFSDRPIVDLVGLVTPEVVRLRAKYPLNCDVFRGVVMDLRPEYIVLRSFEADADQHYYGGPLFWKPNGRAEFFRHYRELTRLPTSDRPTKIGTET